jgi:hypothetical protein
MKPLIKICCIKSIEGVQLFAVDELNSVKTNGNPDRQKLADYFHNALD